ncbi:serine/threonine-protein kinase [Rhodococcus sp. M8-35]|uniref:serine/threonine-protein kinase n=1 Tax=Rhodococcus sp. M8-35 TaxID=3058401 RepID=UPI002ED63C53
MGTVYLAAHPRLPRRVALKLLHRSLTEDEYVRTRFESEADHAARLEHPNIVSVYDRGREGDQLWIAMQYVVGRDAERALKTDGAFETRRAVRIIADSADALDYAHDSGVLHRDVKPANILLEHDRPTRPGRVLLADFGIAKVLAETQHLTKTGMLVASLQYAAPEQFTGDILDARADVYSLGCTLYQLLTGKLPYPGNTLTELMYGHLTLPVPRPSQVRPVLPEDFDAVIAHALAKDRNSRYPTCGALAEAAQQALGDTDDEGATLPEAARTQTVVDALPDQTSKQPDPHTSTSSAAPTASGRTQPAPAETTRPQEPPPEDRDGLPGGQAHSRQQQETEDAGHGRVHSAGNRLRLGLGVMAVLLVLAAAGAGTRLTHTWPFNTEGAETPAALNSPETQQLLALLPTGYDETNCAPEELLGVGQLAALNCTPAVDTLPDVHFYLFQDTVSMTENYNLTLGVRAQQPCPEDGTAGPWSYPDTPDQPEGLMACVKDPFNGGPQIMWTRDRDLLFGIAGSLALEGLYDWWQLYR